MSVKVIDDYNVEVKTKSDGKVVRPEEDPFQRTATRTM